MGDYSTFFWSMVLSTNLVCSCSLGESWHNTHNIDLHRSPYYPSTYMYLPWFTMWCCHGWHCHVARTIKVGVLQGYLIHKELWGHSSLVWFCIMLKCMQCGHTKSATDFTSPQQSVMHIIMPTTMFIMVQGAHTNSTGCHMLLRCWNIIMSNECCVNLYPFYGNSVVSWILFCPFIQPLITCLFRVSATNNACIYNLEMEDHMVQIPSVWNYSLDLTAETVWDAFFLDRLLLDAKEQK